MADQKQKENYLRIEDQFTGTRAMLYPLSAAKLNNNLRRSYTQNRHSGEPFKCWIQARTIRVWRASYKGEELHPDKVLTRYVLGTTRSDVESAHVQWCRKNGFECTTMEQKDKDTYVFKGEIGGEMRQFAATGAKAALEHWAHQCKEAKQESSVLSVVRRVTEQNPFPEPK